MIREVLESVVAIVNAQAWSLSFVADRVNYPRLDREFLGEPGSVTALVFPATRISQQITRGSARPVIPPKHQRDYRVALVLATPLTGTDDTGETDKVIAQCEEIAERFETADQGSGLRVLSLELEDGQFEEGKIVEVEYGTELVLSPEEIESLNVGAGVVVFTVRVIR